MDKDSLGVGRPIEAYDSVNATWVHIEQVTIEASIGMIELGKNGVVGKHAAPSDQVFVVVAGHGWVRTEDMPAISVQRGDRVRWSAGETHESGTAEGMTAVVIECPDVTGPED